MDIFDGVVMNIKILLQLQYQSHPLPSYLKKAVKFITAGPVAM